MQTAACTEFTSLDSKALSWAELPVVWRHSIVPHLLINSWYMLSPFPRGAATEQWSDAPPRTFHEARLSRLMNLYCMRGLPWLLGLHQKKRNPILPHHRPSLPLIFNLFGMCNRLWSGAWRSVDLCQPGLQIQRDRCQPSTQGAVLNTLHWVGESTILALCSGLLELPVSCCSSQASF